MDLIASSIRATQLPAHTHTQPVKYSKLEQINILKRYDVFILMCYFFAVVAAALPSHLCCVFFLVFYTLHDYHCYLFSFLNVVSLISFIH